MTTDELEAKIEGQSESPTLEFKGDCTWDAAGLVKDILAMANMQNGGDIVIGIGDDLVRQGVSQDNLDTYVYDTMKDQMARFADPNVDFKMEFPSDREGRKYVVLQVQPFRSIPVLCKRNGTGLQAGVIYYRNTNAKPESAAISNSSDMRDIIEVAAVRMRQRHASLGLVPTVSDKDDLDKELEGL